jgi:hypothetical protein
MDSRLRGNDCLPDYCFSPQVIPAKAGIHAHGWTPACAGVTAFWTPASHNMSFPFARL